MKDPFGKGKERDAARRAEIEREAAEEVARLTRRTAAPSGGMGGGGMGGTGGGGGFGGGGGVGPPSPLEMMAQQMRERRKPRATPERRGSGFQGGSGGQVAPAGLISGAVGSGFGPAGLNPGPAFARNMNPQPPQAAFTEPEFESTMGRSTMDAPPIPIGDQDEVDDEEMSITEQALMDRAARSGANPEELVVRYDPRTAEEARDRAMRQFHERQKNRTSSRPVTAGMARDPFAPAAMRNQAANAIAQAKASGPPPTAQLGGALGRLAAQRRQQTQAAEPATGGRTAPARPAAGRGAPQRRRPTSADAMEPAPLPQPDAVVEPEPAQEAPVQEGALARLLARRQEPEPEPAEEEPMGRRHSRQRAEARALAPDEVDPTPAEVEPPARPRATRRRAAVKPDAAAEGSVAAAVNEKVSVKKAAYAKKAASAKKPAARKAAPRTGAAEPDAAKEAARAAVRQAAATRATAKRAAPVKKR